MISTRALMFIANPEAQLLIIQSSGRGELSGALAPCVLSMRDMNAVAKLLASRAIGSETVIGKYIVKATLMVPNADGTMDSECVDLADLIGWAKQHVAISGRLN